MNCQDSDFHWFVYNYWFLGLVIIIILGGTIESVFRSIFHRRSKDDD